ARRIAAPVLVEYGAALDALATELEAPLRAQAESYKCPFRPPNFVLLMRKSAELARSGNWLSVGRPKRLLERLKA
ncbi:MAG TPA: hypothetical protein VN673_07105, partial [Clostridia bacterium]|nr:hypothetical protein [Clostridia bacterium]